jgi:hypothetical protein
MFSHMSNNKQQRLIDKVLCSHFYSPNYKAVFIHFNFPLVLCGTTHRLEMNLGGLRPLSLCNFMARVCNLWNLETSFHAELTEADCSKKILP